MCMGNEENLMDEIFKNPTVKQVIFQIKYPNLFFIENKIGDIQLKIMKEFPEAHLVFTRQAFFVDLGPEAKLEDVLQKQESEGRKIWQFNSPKKYQLSITSNSLDITSEFHKTYNNPKSDVRFRDIIEFALKQFFDVTQIPIITRVGLRYIDNCPIKSKDNKTFSSYFNTTFPLKIFDLENVEMMHFEVITKKDNYNLRYVESLRQIDNKFTLIMDFDSFANNINAEEILSITDKLHY